MQRADPKQAARLLLKGSIKRGMEQIAQTASFHLTNWLCAYHLRRKNDRNLPRFVEVRFLESGDGQQYGYVLVPHRHENGEPCEQCADTDEAPFSPADILTRAGMWYEQAHKSYGETLHPEDAVLVIRWLPEPGAHFLAWSRKEDEGLAPA